MLYRLAIAVFTYSLFLGCKSIKTEEISKVFVNLEKLPWQLVMSDDCSEEYIANWHLDASVATIENSDDGMTLKAGTMPYNDTSHMVLWTKQVFEGAIKVEYDYIRRDTSQIGVNIIYLLASGSGLGPYSEDLFEWNELRKVPAMRTYFNHVSTLHISYATFGNGSDEKSYLRARRYLPETGKGLEGTALAPEYYYDDLFEKDVKHHISIIHKDDKIYMKVTIGDRIERFWFDTSSHPKVEKGRIGLRQMWTRSATYSNFKVFQLERVSI